MVNLSTYFTYLSYLGKDFESLTNKIQIFLRFRNFWRYRVFVLCYEPIQKAGNDGKFRKPHFSGKLMHGEGGFHGSKVAFSMKNFEKVSSGQIFV